MNAATRGDGAERAVSAVVEYDYTAKEPDELDLVKGAIIHSIKQMSGGWWEGTLQSNGRTGMFPDNFVRIVNTNDDSTVTLREKSATINRRCKVIYSYTQVNDDELSLAVGDVIEFLGEVEEGWWRGRLKNKVGVFPSNFVVAIEPSPVFASKRPPSTTKQPTVGNVSASLIVGSSVSSSSGAGAAAAASAASAAAAASVAAAAAATKKSNRLSFHSSMEDLLGGHATTAPTQTTPTPAPAPSIATTTTTSSSATLLDDVAPSLPPKRQRDYCRVDFPYAPQNDDELELNVGDIITIISMELPDKGWWKGELRGKVGVFPDNFVKLLSMSAGSSLIDAEQSQSHSRTNAKISTSTHLTSAATSTSTTVVNNSTSASTTSKVLIKKSGSTSSTHSSSHNPKDSFGSRDSLNDILSETGLQSGNVAAQRKSLENKNLDLSNAPDAGNRLALKKQQLQQQQQQQQQQKSTTVTNHTSHTSTTSTAMSSSNTSSANDLRKSLENIDEKTKTPPPVLTKKPTLPTKKSTTVTSVAGNIISGLKQKVKSVENKLSATASHDYADGVGSSRMSPSGIPDAGTAGSVVMRRAATIAVEDSDFDRVERSSILTDMRAGRVKAPKRRPPSAAINTIGESNNNESVYINGSSGGSAEMLASDDGKLHSSDDNSTGEEQLAKPKPREWEKKKVPWMDELKASQVKKKTSPSTEPRVAAGSVADRTSRLLVEDTKISSSTSSNSTSSTSTSLISSSTHTSSSSTSASTVKLQSASISSSSIMQQSMSAVEGSQSLKEMSALPAKRYFVKNLNEKQTTTEETTATTTGVAAATTIDDVRTRPNSLSIRNRSVSPSQSVDAARNVLKSSASPAHLANVAETGNSNASVANVTTTATGTTTATAKSNAINNHHSATTSQTLAEHSNGNNSSSHSSHSHSSSSRSSSSKPTAGNPTSNDDGSGRVVELERRVEKLEAVVHAQQRTIDELVRTLRDETDRVKVLRGELDKYAQCVTQV